MTGYAYIMTHPGVPCLLHEHVFKWKLADEIKPLVELRRRAGINRRSKLEILCAEDDMCAAPPYWRSRPSASARPCCLLFCFVLRIGHQPLSGIQPAHSSALQPLLSNCISDSRQAVSLFLLVWSMVAMHESLACPLRQTTCQSRCTGQFKIQENHT